MGLISMLFYFPGFSQDASLDGPECNDCQYVMVDKGCFKVEVSFSGGEFSASLKSGSRVSCKAGNGNCNSTSCS